MPKKPALTMTMAEAREWCGKVNSMPQAEFDALLARWAAHDVGEVPEALSVMRATILGAFDRRWGTSARDKYATDVEVGLELYGFTGKLSNFGVTKANNNDFWRFLTIKVFPDITYARYPVAEDDGVGGRINHKRFYEGTRRIWLKTLWWYVHLSWQGSEGATRRVLETGGANCISKLIETPGRGYRVEAYRAMMREYASHGTFSNDAFNFAMKLNGALCRTGEPELWEGGVQGYAKELFDSAFAAVGQEAGER